MMVRLGNAEWFDCEAVKLWCDGPPRDVVEVRVTDAVGHLAVTIAFSKDEAAKLEEALADARRMMTSVKIDPSFQPKP